MMLRTRAFPLTSTLSSHRRHHITTRALLYHRTTASIWSNGGPVTMETAVRELTAFVPPTSSTSSTSFTSSSSSFGPPGASSGEPRLAVLEDMFDTDDAPRRAAMALDDDGGEGVRRAEADLGLASVVRDALNPGDCGELEEEKEKEDEEDEEEEGPPPQPRAGAEAEDSGDACDAAEEERSADAAVEDDVPCDDNDNNGDSDNDEDDGENVANVLAEEDMEELAAAVAEGGVAPASPAPMFFKDAGAAKAAGRCAPAAVAGFDDMAAEDVELESVGEAMPSPKRR